MKTLFACLREERLRIARELDVPAYYIASNKVLEAICEACPETLEDLQKILGPKRTENYGEALLEALEVNRNLKHILSCKKVRTSPVFVILDELSDLDSFS